MKRRCLCLVMAGGLLATGCALPLDGRSVGRRGEPEVDPAVQQAQRERLARETMQADIDGLKDRIEAMEQRQQDLYAQFDQVKAAAEAENKQTRETLAATDRALQEKDAAIARMKEELLVNLSKTIAEFMKTRPPAPAPRSTAGSRAAAGGKEHVVKPGETLSGIARAYGVKPQSLIEANGLKSADVVRVGQKLVIPE